MLAAIFWSGLATGTLLIGMVLAYWGLVNNRWNGLIMSFGAGAIVSAVAYQLLPMTALQGGTGHILIAASIAAGALTYYFADRWVARMGGQHRMDFEGAQAGGSGMGMLLGSLLDGVPESVVLGISLVQSPQVSLAFVFAVAVSNIPQALGGTTGLLEAGWAKSRISRLWLYVCLASVAAAILGYVLARFLSSSTGMVFDAFAAGALLVMLTDSMIPEAFKHGGKAAGLSLVVGYGVAAGMSLMQMSS